jgi:wyosine [tRNA(Phe)-imidazoG37] synthetase (radical SAM superfamily)
VGAVRERLAQCRATGQSIDFATFIPDGEPTLDLHLGEEIRGVAALGLKVAVLTNGSLLWREDVRTELMSAAQVSLKVDTVDEEAWRHLNRPIGNLDLETVLDGMRHFAAEYRGDLVTETMLVAGLHDDEASLMRTAAFVSKLKPLCAYVAVPSRPPAEPWVRPPNPDDVHRAAEVFRRAGVTTSCLIEEDEAPFAAVGDPAQGLLGIVAVHPMTEVAARDYLVRSGAGWSIAEELLDSGRIQVVRYGRQTYLRGAHGRDPATMRANRMGAPVGDGVAPPGNQMVGMAGQDEETR